MQGVTICFANCIIASGLREKESLWTDIIFDPEKYLIYESVVNTKTHGSFSTVNEYDDQIYPSLTVVTFEAKKFKLPLKFIGSQQSGDPKARIDDNTRGKVVLRYSYL